MTPAAVSSAESSAESIARRCRVLSNPTTPKNVFSMKIGTTALLCVPTPLKSARLPSSSPGVMQTLRPERSSALNASRHCSSHRPFEGWPR